jgi:hypothetical protein
MKAMKARAADSSARLENFVGKVSLAKFRWQNFEVKNEINSRWA